MDDYVEVFDKRLQVITTTRGEIYGPPLEDFERAQRMIVELASCEDPAIRHAMQMICVKLSRLVTTPDHLDSIIDIAGYARTMAMVISARLK